MTPKKIRPAGRISSSLVLFLLFALTACELQQAAKLADMQALVDQVGAQFVPDKRLDVFHVELQQDDGKVSLTGEVVNPALPVALLDSLTKTYPGADFVDEIKVLPDSGLGSRTYGIVKIGVANQRRAPRFQAELVNQSLLGSVVRIYKVQGAFYYIQNWDGYLGWMSKGSVVRVDSAAAAAWQTAESVVCISNYGVVADLLGGANEEYIVDLAPGATLKKLGSRAGFVKVETPDRRVGFVKEGTVVARAKMLAVRATRDRIVETSRKFLGVPYLWGGSTAKGFDCSGFVQNVFFLNNMSLPRDASQLANEGIEVDPGKEFENLMPGDLLFFGDKPGRITHVAIYLGDRLYIHASHSVHIKSLDAGHPLFSEYRYNAFQKATRLL